MPHEHLECDTCGGPDATRRRRVVRCDACRRLTHRSRELVLAKRAQGARACVSCGNALPVQARASRRFCDDCRDGRERAKHAGARVGLGRLVGPLAHGEPVGTPTVRLVDVEHERGHVAAVLEVRVTLRMALGPDGGLEPSELVRAQPWARSLSIVP